MKRMKHSSDVGRRGQTWAVTWADSRRGQIADVGSDVGR